MKTWHKVLIVFTGGGLSWALSYCSSLWPQYAVVMASLSSASTATVGLLVGWTPRAE